MKAQPIITLIVATEKNGFIGKDNQLLWHLPNDLRFFKEKTSDHHIIMGRKTFESLGFRALPRRKNIIISRQPDYLDRHSDKITVPKSAELSVFQSLSDALEFSIGEKEVFVIGGGVIYRDALPFAKRVFRTLVDVEITGDTSFPQLPDDEWKLVESVFHPQDEAHPFSFTFQTFEKK